MQIKENHSVHLKPKLINGQPFIEVTIFNKENSLGSGRAVDQTAFSVIENQTMFKVIMNWMFGGTE